jgi:hypothetical protein
MRFEANPRKKVSECPPQPIIMDVVVCICHASYAGSINRRITIQASLGISGRSY